MVIAKFKSSFTSISRSMVLVGKRGEYDDDDQRKERRWMVVKKDSPVLIES